MQTNSRKIMEKNNFLCNLEMNEPGKKEIEIKFPYTGTYRFKNIRVVVQPVEKIIKMQKTQRRVLMDGSVQMGMR